jgi:hypothetical protein
MPQGKPANTRCVQLSEQPVPIFGSPLRPKVCASLQPAEMCAPSRRSHDLAALELPPRLTAPPLNVFNTPQAGLSDTHQRNPEHRVIAPDFRNDPASEPAIIQPTRVVLV